MSKALDELLDLLNLEPIEQGIFRGQSEHLGLPQVYGGQVIGQSLSAAKQTVEPNRFVHSFHSYFLVAGDPTKPIVYDVENIRDGGSFSTRRVKAIQFGRPIFFMTASFQIQENGFEHQDEMPKGIPMPEDLMSEQQMAQQIEAYLPEAAKTLLLGEKPFEIRPVNPINFLDPKPMPAKQYLWFKATGTMPVEQGIHQYLLAYASDWNFLPTALMPHGVTLMTPSMKVATIDHSMWFHRPIKVDEWLLYEIDSTSASGARGFVRGKIFDRKGNLVASAAQEGLMRQADFKKESNN